MKTSRKNVLENRNYRGATKAELKWRKDKNNIPPDKSSRSASQLLYYSWSLQFLVRDNAGAEEIFRNDVISMI